MTKSEGDINNIQTNYALKEQIAKDFVKVNTEVDAVKSE